MPSASAQVTSSDISGACAPRSDRMKISCVPTPARNIAGIRSRIDRNGSRPRWVKRVWLRYAARITNAPWATLITRMIPNTSVSPLAISA